MIEIFILWDSPFDRRLSAFKKACNGLGEKKVKCTFLDITQQQKGFLEILKNVIWQKRKRAWENFEKTRKKFEAKQLPAVVFYIPEVSKAVLFPRPTLAEKKTFDSLHYFFLDMIFLLKDENLLCSTVSDAGIQHRIAEFCNLDSSVRDLLEIVRV